MEVLPCQPQSDIQQATAALQLCLQAFHKNRCLAVLLLEFGEDQGFLGAQFWAEWTGKDTQKGCARSLRAFPVEKCLGILQQCAYGPSCAWRHFRRKNGPYGLLFRQPSPILRERELLLSRLYAHAPLA